MVQPCSSHRAQGVEPALRAGDGLLRAGGDSAPPGWWGRVGGDGWAGSLGQTTSPVATKGSALADALNLAPLFPGPPSPFLPHGSTHFLLPSLWIGGRGTRGGSPTCTLPAWDAPRAAAHRAHVTPVTGGVSHRRRARPTPPACPGPALSHQRAGIKGAGGCGSCQRHGPAGGGGRAGRGAGPAPGALPAGARGDLPALPLPQPAAGARRESLVRAQLVLGCRDEAVRARLLREDGLSLARAVQICREAEETGKPGRRAHGAASRRDPGCGQPPGPECQARDWLRTYV